jgi:putative phosphoesterase
VVETALRVAFISDIHGNWPALQAVLQDFKKIDACICCGDVVGYYPYVNEVCTELRNIGALVVRGNHDAFVVGQLDPDPNKSQAYRVEWTRKHLMGTHLTWLASLPVEMAFRWGTFSIKACHASPWDEDTYLYPDTEMLQNISLAKNMYIVSGHTHHPMKVKCGKGYVINPGSVGQPRDWDPRASYATFDLLTGKLQFCRVKYDVMQLKKDLKLMGWKPSSIDILDRQRSGYEQSHDKT